MDRTGISGDDKKEEYAEINLGERGCERGWQDMINVEIFRQLAEHLPYGLYIVSPDRTILFWNDEAEHITGYTREEMSDHKPASSG